MGGFPLGGDSAPCSCAGVRGEQRAESDPVAGLLKNQATHRMGARV